MLHLTMEQFSVLYTLILNDDQRVPIPIQCLKNILAKHIVKRLGLIFVVKRYIFCMIDRCIYFHHIHSAGDK